ncbi:MAG: hypothetical protein NTW87_08055 [Planctomycetota bacterium]|nr:hypothetical protein [Planctomycetota bacterium]
MDSHGFKLLAVGVFLLLVGGGLTLWSYLNRDPITGEFFVWVKTLLVGAVSVIAGWFWMSKENEPLA